MVKNYKTEMAGECTLIQHSVQQISKSLSIPKETLRYYDKINLVTPIRGENRYRYYTQEHINELMYVQVMKFAGFSLSEIKRVLHNKNDGTTLQENTDDTLLLLGDKKNETLKKISSLKSIVHLIEISIHAMEGKNCLSDIDELVIHIYNSIKTGGEIDV